MDPLRSRLVTQPRLFILILAVCLSMPALVKATSRQAVQGTAHHCVIDLAPLQPGQRTSEVLAFRCFDTFSSAMAAATDGLVQLEPGIGPGDVTETMLAPAGETIFGIDYTLVDYAGFTLIKRSSAGGCSPTQSFSIGFFTDFWWNDTISSTRAFAGCDVNKLYPDIFWQGVGVTCYPDCAALGAMDNQTSSRLWCHTASPCPVPVTTPSPTPTWLATQRLYLPLARGR